MGKEDDTLHPNGAAGRLSIGLDSSVLTQGRRRTTHPPYVGYVIRSRFRLVVRSLVIHWFLFVLA
jgi:hypothetical protein